MSMDRSGIEIVTIDDLLPVKADQRGKEKSKMPLSWLGPEKNDLSRDGQKARLGGSTHRTWK